MIDSLHQHGYVDPVSPASVLQLYQKLGCEPDQLTSALENAEVGRTPVPFLLWLYEAQKIEVYLLEFAAAALCAALLVCWQRRPQGWVQGGLLETRPSSVPGAGLGVFALQPISRGVVLGAYPGRPRAPAEMINKVANAPAAKGYAFDTGKGWFLDPTDAAGQLTSWPAPGPPWLLPADPTLALVNEPPPGSGGTNVSVEDGEADLELLFVTTRDIGVGEELFIDYGVVYDRRHYRH